MWPQVEALLDSHPVAGVAVAAVCDGEVVARGFGVRDVGSGAPVTPETMFHLASVSKPVVATATVLLARDGGADGSRLDLDAPITEWLPEFTLADGREADVTARGLLTHSSGLPDVADYGWHDPQLGDDALSELARSLSGWRLQSEPGSTFSYSNAGYELLGLLLSRVTGTTFEDAVRRLVLSPLGMRRSTFLRSDVPRHLAASPHVGMPLAVPEDAYPYTRRHAPSSSLHSNLVEMSRWITAHLEPTDDDGGSGAPGPRLDAALRDLMWRPTVPVGEPPWEESAALGWAVGTYRGDRTLSHSGADPGFGAKLVLVPERGTGVVVLANSNTVPTSTLAAAALDVVLAVGDGRPRTPLPPVVGPVGEVLATSGPGAARDEFHRLTTLDPAAFDLDDEVFVDAVWGAIELHRTSMVWPLLDLWTELRPDSSAACTMTGWAHRVDGDLGSAGRLLRRALDLDPANHEASQLLDALPSS